MLELRCIRIKLRPVRPGSKIGARATINGLMGWMPFVAHLQAQMMPTYFLFFHHTDGNKLAPTAWFIFPSSLFLYPNTILCLRSKCTVPVGSSSSTLRVTFTW